MRDYNDFERLLKSPFSEVRELATKAKNYKELFDSNQISKPEYDDLMNDLISLEKIDRSLFSAELWNIFMQAVEVIKALRALAII